MNIHYFRLSLLQWMKGNKREQSLDEFYGTTSIPDARSVFQPASDGHQCTSTRPTSIGRDDTGPKTQFETVICL